MIYFIEDDESTRSAYELFIASMELDHMSFESVEAFLAGCSPSETDLIILDLNLPGMSGVDLLKKFSNEKLNIPVIVITAHDAQQSREECMLYGVKGYLRKPVNGMVLFEIIKKNLSIN